MRDLHGRPPVTEAECNRAELILKKMFEVIDFLTYKLKDDHGLNLYFVIENPATGRLKYHDLMKDIRHFDTSYCKYGFKWSKPTRFWTNLPFLKLHPVCSPTSPCNRISLGKSHTNALSVDSESLYEIPETLIKVIGNTAYDTIACNGV